MKNSTRSALIGIGVIDNSVVPCLSASLVCTHASTGLWSWKNTTDWVSGRIYAPKLEEVLDGALSQAKGQHYYMSTFRYPERGGFQSYSGLLQRGSRIHFQKRLVNVDFCSRKLTFADGTHESFEKLISTLPLPELIRMTTNCPEQVQEAAKKLVCTSHFLVSLGINRPHLSDAYWTYYSMKTCPSRGSVFPTSTRRMQRLKVAPASRRK